MVISMHIDLIIISKLILDLQIFSDLNYLVIEPKEIHRNYIITNTDEKITFDYLIIDRLIPGLPILKENKHIITNQFYETSLENVFAIGEINSSSKSLSVQLNTIYDYIKNPF